MYFFPINKKKVVISIIIAGISAIGDKNSENQSNSIAAAICDNVTHGLIGMFTWIGIYAAKTSNPDYYFFIEILLCGLFSSLIDVDHFIAAKSMRLKDATSLKSRPFMHCTSLLFLLVISLLTLSYILKLNWLYKLTWIFTAAFLSHHIRDSKRRGFWLWPFGSTVPLPNYVYIVLQMLLPHFLSAVISSFDPPEIFRVSYETVETV